MWMHDVQYDLKSKGRYKLEALLDDQPIAGSPIEWHVKHRTTA